jgi:hypothetical protein
VDREVEEQCVQHGQCGVADRAACWPGWWVPRSKFAARSQKRTAAFLGIGWKRTVCGALAGHRRCNVRTLLRRRSLPGPRCFQSHSFGCCHPLQDRFDFHPHLRFARLARAQRRGAAGHGGGNDRTRNDAHLLFRPHSRRAPSRLAPQRLHGRRATVCRSRMVADRRATFADDHTAGTRLVIASSRRSAGRSRLPVTSRKRRAGSRHLIGWLTPERPANARFPPSRTLGGRRRLSGRGWVKAAGPAACRESRLGHRRSAVR